MLSTYKCIQLLPSPRSKPRRSCVRVLVTFYDCVKTAHAKIEKSALWDATGTFFCFFFCDKIL